MIYFLIPCRTLAIRTSLNDQQFLTRHLEVALVTQEPPNYRGNLVLPLGMPITEYTSAKFPLFFLCQFSAISMGALGSPSVLMALKWNYGTCV